MPERRRRREAGLAWRFRGAAGFHLAAAPRGQEPSSPPTGSFPSEGILSHLPVTAPDRKTPLNFLAAREVPALRESNLTFNCIFAEVGEGHCPLLNVTQVPQPRGLDPRDLAGGTGTKQLLFCQTPLDKCSTFNDELCKPHAKHLLASKLDFSFSLGNEGKCK